jgi:hypothetical protein
MAVVVAGYGGLWWYEDERIGEQRWCVWEEKERETDKTQDRYCSSHRARNQGLDRGADEAVEL